MLILCLAGVIIIAVIVIKVYKVYEAILKEKVELSLSTNISIMIIDDVVGKGYGKDIFKEYFIPKTKLFLFKNKILFNIIVNYKAKSFLNSLIEKVESNNSKSIEELKREIIKDIGNFLIISDSSMFTLVNIITSIPEFEDRIVSIVKKKLKDLGSWSLKNIVIFSKNIINVRYFWEILRQRENFRRNCSEISWVISYCHTKIVRDEAWDLIKKHFSNEVYYIKDIVLHTIDDEIRDEAWSLYKFKFDVDYLTSIIKWSKNENIKTEAKELLKQKIESL